MIQTHCPCHNGNRNEKNKNHKTSLSRIDSDLVPTACGGREHAVDSCSRVATKSFHCYSYLVPKAQTFSVCTEVRHIYGELQNVIGFALKRCFHNFIEFPSGFYTTLSNNRLFQKYRGADPFFWTTNFFAYEEHLLIIFKTTIRGFLNDISAISVQTSISSFYSSLPKAHSSPSLFFATSREWNKLSCRKHQYKEPRNIRIRSIGLKKSSLKHLFEENSLQSMKQNGMKVANNVASFSNIVSKICFYLYFYKV